ncbi:tetraacyldisaccharide 4'-kinase [Undibacterium sp. Ji22W]|uniref:tetraacyldisaccharide 4'-kinase n=1 Tax=Undibacterium sp. Ji22W TaxID=3413038 RepID=UPI003BF17AF4
MRASLESFFIQAWSKRGMIALLLWPMSKLFGLLLNFRFGLLVLGYRRQTQVKVPVIIVGNIYIGGTGKTPLVIWLVETLRQAGWNPGVISRGYGAHVERIQEVSENSLASEVGDEPLLIVQRTGCPMTVGRNRVASAQQLLSSHPTVDVIISDDGLQHYALGRDIEILMFDQRGIGNGWLLPAGPLREPASRRRDFTILNSAKPDQVDDIGDEVFSMHLQMAELINLSQSTLRQSLSAMRGKKILAAAGIGNPQRFFSMLSAQELVFKAMPLPDHFAFFTELFQHEDAEIILITEKDAVKCRQIAGLRDDPRIWLVPVAAELDAEFKNQLLKLLELTSEKKHGCTSA